jgi:hypothetical protein
MKNTRIAFSLFAAGLMAAAGAQAQYYNGAAATYDTPIQAGEASTMTQGVPNAKTTNSPYPDGTPVVVLGPNVVTSPYYGQSYVYPAQVVTSPSYTYPAYTTPVYPAVVATAPSYTYPHNPAVVMPRQVVPGGTTYYYYPR